MADPVEHKPKIRRRRSTRARLPLPDTIDPLDIAVKRVAEGDEEGGDLAALTLVKKQSRLIDAELNFVTVQTLSHKIGLVLKAAALILVLLLLAVSASFLWRAAREPLATVQPFGTPPALEQRGIDGTMLASSLLDHLNDIAEKTSSRRRPSSYSGGWSDNIRVEVPNTGLSLNELVALARRWAGNETLISGELVQRGDALVLSARISGKPARRYSGSEADIDALLRQAAEGIYQDSQPYRHAVYLMRTDRFDQANAEYEKIHRFGDPVEQRWARSYLAEQALGSNDLGRADMLLSAVLTDAPWFAYAVGVRASAAALRGHNEEALRWGQREAEALASNQWREIVTDRGLAMQKYSNRANVALLRGDFRSALAETNRAATVNLYNFDEAAPAIAAGILAGLHEPQRALGLLDRLPAGAAINGFNYYHSSPLVEDAIAEMDDWARYTQALRRLDQQMAGQGLTFLRSTQIWPRLAVSEARLGRKRIADRITERLPIDCYRCMIARGQVAALGGRLSEAERWFAEAEALAPSLPQAPLEWGRALLESRRFDDAIEKFREAHRRGPQWSDPLRYWGDALLRQKRPGAAAERYQLAAERAPRWAGLHLNWAAAEWHGRRQEQARGRLKFAETLELTQGQRAQLGRIRQAMHQTKPEKT